MITLLSASPLVACAYSLQQCCSALCCLLHLESLLSFHNWRSAVFLSQWPAQHPYDSCTLAPTLESPALRGLLERLRHGKQLPGRQPSRRSRRHFRLASILGDWRPSAPEQHTAVVSSGCSLPANAAAAYGRPAQFGGRHPISDRPRLRACRQGGSTTLRCSLPTTAARRTPPCPPAAAGSRSSRRQQGLEPLDDGDADERASQASRRSTTSAAAAAAAEAEATARLAADGLEAATRAAEASIAAARATAAAADREANIRRAAADDAEERASQRASPAGSPRAELRRSARLAEARAAIERATARAPRNNVDSDDEEREPVSNAAICAAALSASEDLQRAFRASGRARAIWLPIKQLSTKQGATIPLLHGATGRGANRQVQPLQAWLDDFVAHMAMCGVTDQSDLCYYTTRAVKPESEAALFVATKIAAGTWPRQSFGDAWVAIEDHFMPVNAIDLSIGSFLSMSWQNGDTASTYNLRTLALTEDLRSLHRRLSEQADRDGQADSIPDLVECLALALAEKGLPAAWRERLSLSNSRRFLRPEFTSRLDAVLRQVDMSRSRSSVNTISQSPHHDNYYNNHNNHGGSSNGGSGYGGNSYGGGGGNGYNGGNRDRPGGGRNGSNGGSSSGNRNSSSGGSIGGSSSSSGSRNSSSSGSIGGSSGGSSTSNSGGNGGNSGGRNSSRRPRNRNGNDQQQDGAAQSQPLLGLPRPPPDFPPQRRSANAVAPASQPAMPVGDRERRRRLCRRPLLREPRRSLAVASSPSGAC